MTEPRNAPVDREGVHASLWTRGRVALVFWALASLLWEGTRHADGLAALSLWLLALACWVQALTVWTGWSERRRNREGGNA